MCSGVLQTLKKPKPHVWTIWSESLMNLRGKFDLFLWFSVAWFQFCTDSPLLQNSAALRRNWRAGLVAKMMPGRWWRWKTGARICDSFTIIILFWSCMHFCNHCFVNFLQHQENAKRNEGCWAAAWNSRKSSAFFPHLWYRAPQLQSGHTPRQESARKNGECRWYSAQHRGWSVKIFSGAIRVWMLIHCQKIFIFCSRLSRRS